MITISTLAILAMSCRSFEIVPLVSVIFDNPMVRVDSCGNMEISDSGKAWYPVNYDTGRMMRFDTLQTDIGETFLIPKQLFKAKRYQVWISQDWQRTVLEDGYGWDTTYYFDNYNAKYYISLAYPPLQWIDNIKYRDAYFVRNYRDMQTFHNELPDTIISDMETMYLDDSLFIIKTKYPDEYVIIPDCFWNMEDVINYEPIRLYDNSLEFKDTGHKYKNKSVFIITNRSTDDWQTVFVKNEKDPSVYTGYLTRREYNH